MLATAPPSGLAWTLFNNTAPANEWIELQVTTGVAGVPGDYNSNGTVDAADYYCGERAFPLNH